MSLWLEILQQTAAGNTSEARGMLDFELPLILRTPEINREGLWQYGGPLPRRVRNFIESLPDAERGMAVSRVEDFVDYIADLVLAQVRRTVSLLEHCVKYPEHSIADMAEGFTGWDGMKRNVNDRKSWIRKHLLSMLAADISLPSQIADELKGVASDDNKLYGYHEIALLNKWQLDLSWSDFKSREEIGRSYLCVEDSGSDEDGGVGDEGFDYGAPTAAQVVLNLSTPATSEFAIDAIRLGRELTCDLLQVLESFTVNKPTDGYLPIARHNVWWKIVLRYAALPFKLGERDPFCTADIELARHISESYPDVIKPSRLNIFRRRTRFEEKCLSHSQSILMNWAKTNFSDSQKKE